jgi:undecaprenyl-diphosphatase
MHSFIIFCAQYIFLVPVALLAFAFIILEPKLRRSLFLRLFGAALLGVGFAYIGGDLYHETRPFIALHLTPLIPHGNDNAFPSDHTLVAALCSFLMLPYRLTFSIIGLIATALAAWARVASHLHSPLDVIASIVFAGFACVMMQQIVRKVQKTVPEPEAAYHRHQKAA